MGTYPLRNRETAMEKHHNGGILKQGIGKRLRNRDTTEKQKEGFR